MKACFIGHRKITNANALYDSIKNTVLTLIDKGVTTFFFGGKGNFDNLSWQAVTELKHNYPFIKRVYVRAAYQIIDEFYEKYLLESYEETYFPPRLQKTGKYSYVERNYEMIDCSALCVFYYNDKYLPLTKQTASHAAQSKSGTKIAYEYALKKKKQIINLFN